MHTYGGDADGNVDDDDGEYDLNIMMFIQMNVMINIKCVQLFICQKN